MAVYGVLGDIHGNLEALRAVLAALDRHRIDRLLCVGDIVGYNADPDACAALLRERDALAIAGNHDLIGTNRLGFDRCSNKAMHSLKRTRSRLSRETDAYLRSLPPHLAIEDRVLLVHGGVRDVEQYMTRPEHFLENARHLRADHPGRTVCFYGHTHEQKVVAVDGDEVQEIAPGDGVALRADRLHFVNPGSVDASRKRAHKEAQFALYDGARSQLAFFRVPYDEALTESKAAHAGYRLDRLSDAIYSVRRRLLALR